MIKAIIVGPIHFDDLSTNPMIRKFLMNFSKPIRYLAGLSVGLYLGALYPENLTQFGVLLLAVCALAVLWVVLSLFARNVIRKALNALLDDTETLSEYQFMYSKSWIAAVKVKETK